MIDSEGLPMACAYCLLAAEQARFGPIHITYPDPDDHRREFEVIGADQLVTKLDGQRVFTIKSISSTMGTTTGMPATVVNGTWVCALHVKDSIMAWDRRRFG